MDRLEQLLQQVVDEPTFLRFVRALADDFEADREESARSPGSPYGPSPRGWENLTLGAFLDAAHAWGSATEERGRGENPWRRCAQVLYAGKHYE